MDPGGAAAPERAAPPPRSAALSRPATLVYVVLWLALTVYGWRGYLVEGHAPQLLWPLDAAARVIDRDLHLADALAGRPAWERAAWSWIEGTPDELRAGAVDVQREAIAVGAERGAHGLDVARARLAVLLAESRDLDAAFSAARDTRDPVALTRVLLAAYGAGGRGAAEALPETPASQLDGWAGGRLRLRLARRGGDAGTAEAWEEVLRARAAHVLARSRMVGGAQLVVMGVGLGLLLGWTARGTLPAAPPERRGPAPWTLETGLAVLVRGDVWNRLYFVALAELPAAWVGHPAASPFVHGGTLFASLPLVYLAWRHLLVAGGDPLGLRPRAPRPSALAGFALAVAAVDLLLTNLVGWTSGWLGRGWDWAEGFSETLVWSPDLAAALAALDLVVWAPLFEELAFRGVLFLSLRRHLGAGAAAATSALAFGALHFYSWAGLAATTASGLVWALAFERVRSLWPGVAAHAIYNALYVAGVVLFHR